MRTSKQASHARLSTTFWVSCVLATLNCTRGGHFALWHAVSKFVVSHLSLVVHFNFSAFRDRSFVRVIRHVAVIDAEDCAWGTVVWTSAEGRNQRCGLMWLLRGPVSPYHRRSVLQITLAACPADRWAGFFCNPQIAKSCNFVCFFTARPSLGLAEQAPPSAISAVIITSADPKVVESSRHLSHGVTCVLSMRLAGLE